MKINLFCWGDSNDINTWSNVPYFFAGALESRGIEVRRLNLIPEPGLIQWALVFVHRIRNRFASLLGRSPRPLLRVLAFQRLVNSRLAKVCRKFPDADLNLFLTFSVSSYRYSSVPVAHYCDRTYEHHLEEESIAPGYADRGLFRMEKRNLQNARHVFCLNRACLNFVRDRYRVESAVLLKAGINLFSSDDIPDVNALIAGKEASRDILFIGRGYQKRGVDILLNAFQLFNAKFSDPFSLHMVGVAPNELRQLPARVVCHGYLRKDDPAEYRMFIELLGSARLFVFPMRFGPIASVLREALWMCTPVILTNVPDAAERIQDGKNGLLAVNCDAEDIAKQMSYLVENRQLWREMAAFAHESVRNGTWDVTVEDFLRFLHQRDL